MGRQQHRAVWLLGACQCVFWGVLYYSFSVLLVPMESELGLTRAAVAGAFSLGLCAMAFAAPTIGRALDAGRAVQVNRLGAALAAAGLSTVALAEAAPMLYLGWACIGTAMAMLLYESAFAVVTKAIEADHDRLRALAAVTVMGGLASTLFLPVLSLTIDAWGWRGTVWLCAAMTLIAAGAMEWLVLPKLPLRAVSPSGVQEPHGRWPQHLGSLIVVFATSTLASMALTTLLIPLLIGRGTSAWLAALTLGALGLSQLPGRIWLLRGGRATSSRALNFVPITLQAVGLLIVVASTSATGAAAGVLAFGLGAGLQTLARPWLVQALYGAGNAGRWNGEVARAQGFARAAGPLLAAFAAQWAGSGLVLTAAGGLVAVTLVVAGWIPVPEAQAEAHGA